MEKYFTFLIGASLLICAFGQDLEVKFDDDSDRYVMAGNEAVTFTCRINRNAVWAMNNKLQFVRRAAGEDVVLSSLGQLVQGEPAYYRIAVNQEGGNIIMEMTILEVRDVDDGEMVCRVVPNDDSKVGQEASVEIFVVRPLTSLALQFANNVTITESRNSPLPVDTGKYKIKCIAEGSNPGTNNVHLFLHGTEITPAIGPIVEKIADNPRQFRSHIEADIDIGHMHSGNDLECTASSRAQDSHSVKMPLKVNVYDPTTKCEPAKAYKGERYPEVRCTVNHKNLDDVKFKFQLGETGEVIEDGDQNEDYVEVMSKPINNTYTQVTLKLYQADDWHFSTDFYLLTEHSGGYVSKSEAIRLMEEEGPGDSASSLVASVVTLVLAAVCALLESL